MLHSLLETVIKGYGNFTSENSILSGYPVLRGPVSLIVNIKVRVGNTLQICRRLLWNNLFFLHVVTHENWKTQLFPCKRVLRTSVPLLKDILLLQTFSLIDIAHPTTHPFEWNSSLMWGESEMYFTLMFCYWGLSKDGLDIIHAFVKLLT